MTAIQIFLRRVSFFYKRSSLTTNWKVFFILDLIAPITQTLCFSLIASFIYGSEFVREWMIGNALLISSFGALYGVGTQILVEKNSGTLNLLIASPTTLNSIFLASTFSALVNSLLAVSLGLISVSCVLGITWSLELTLSMAFVIGVSLFVCLSFGYLFSCLILVTTETNLIINIVSRLLLILTGANFPLAKLPPLVQKLSEVLPLTRSIFVAQQLMKGRQLRLFVQPIVEEVILAVIYLFLAGILLRVLENKARNFGNVEFI